MMKKQFLTIALITISLIATQNITAAETVEQILEKARAKGQEIEKLKKVITDEPDQNVRLAAFQLMVANGDPIMREVALDVGLSSADALMQAAAFKDAILGLDRLHLTITGNTKSTPDKQKQCTQWIAKRNDSIIIELKEKDRKKGTFSSSGKGQISGTLITYNKRGGGGYRSVTLQLEDDNTLRGKVAFSTFNCLATTQFR